MWISNSPPSLSAGRAYLPPAPKSPGWPNELRGHQACGAASPDARAFHGGILLSCIPARRGFYSFLPRRALFLNYGT